VCGINITTTIARDPYPVLVESIFDDLCENKKLAMTNEKMERGNQKPNQLRYVYYVYWL
jgi:hypothetical protein